MSHKKVKFPHEKKDGRQLWGGQAGRLLSLEGVATPPMDDNQLLDMAVPV